MPDSVTLTVVPGEPEEGLIEVSVGSMFPAGVTLKEAFPLVPADVVTETLYCPTPADRATARSAVTLVLLTIITFDTVIPAPTLTVRGATKLVPVRVTGTDEP